MSTRDVFCRVWLTEGEAEQLKNYAVRCGLTQSALMRMLIQGYRPQPLPLDSFWAVMNELYFIHDCFKAIADSVASEGAREAQTRTADFILRLQAAVTLPERVVIRCGDHQDLGD